MRHDQNYNWGSGMTVFSVVMVIFIAVILLWHFAEAWRILPGAYYISGQVPVSIEPNHIFDVNVALSHLERVAHLILDVGA